MELLNQPPDVSGVFEDARHQHFQAAEATGFGPETGRGTLRWKRKRLGATMLFNHQVPSLEDVGANEFPRDVYAVDPELPFSVEAVSVSTLRIRLSAVATPAKRAPSLMLVGGPRVCAAWKHEAIAEGHRYTSAAGSVLIGLNPWRIVLSDPTGRVLTETVPHGIPQCGFVRRAGDFSRAMAAVFSLAPGEKLFGCGESFMEFDKRGSRVVVSTTDALGTENPRLYKPVPFFLSSRGYGMFVHTSAPLTFDFGAAHAARNVVMVDDEELDLFLFLGSPKEVIGAYTELTGRAALPPLWSFGLWMSRITYTSEAEVRGVAATMREHRIPGDVVHIDTGWFQNDWECDYRFSPQRFDDPARMIRDLRDDGFRVSLWQLPYFIPRNPLFREIVERGLAVRAPNGGLPGEDAILDFSNPETVRWYQEKLAGLLRLGVGAIKTDFGEAAPWNGLYASGLTGHHEHNLYPLRYQQTAADVTRRETGDTIIWARAAWAGAQRNPLHWGGDAGRSYSAMAATLRGGLSLGLCGFSFWSHDIGGFAGPNDLEVYSRWIPFGMLTSHARVHGEPPKEPWLLGDELLAEFRRADEFRYRLIPYIYAQAAASCAAGLPMVRALFVEFPEDPGAWLVDDAYLFGTSLYVAPLFERGTRSRDVYLPPGLWHDYQTRRTYTGGWHHIEAGAMPVIVLVRDGTALPHCELAQSTAHIDWSHLELVVFASEATRTTEALVCLPGAQPTTVRLHREAGGFVVEGMPLGDAVQLSIGEPE